MPCLKSKDGTHTLSVGAYSKFHSFMYHCNNFCHICVPPTLFLFYVTIFYFNIYVGFYRVFKLKVMQVILEKKNLKLYLIFFSLPFMPSSTSPHSALAITTLLSESMSSLFFFSLSLLLNASIPPSSPAP